MVIFSIDQSGQLICNKCDVVVPWWRKRPDGTMIFQCMKCSGVMEAIIPTMYMPTSQS